MNAPKELSPKQREELLKTLQARFEKNMNRHEGLAWAAVQARLEDLCQAVLKEVDLAGGEFRPIVS